MKGAVEGARRLELLFGEYLVGDGLVSRPVLSKALESQLIHKVASLANLAPETEYAYWRDVNILEAWGGGELTLAGPLNAILASVRVWHDRARIRATLGRIGNHPLVFHPDADPTSLALTTEERTLLDTIRAARSTLARCRRCASSTEKSPSVARVHVRGHAPVCVQRAKEAADGGARRGDPDLGRAPHFAQRIVARASNAAARDEPSVVARARADAPASRAPPRGDAASARARDRGGHPSPSPVQGGDTQPPTAEPDPTESFHTSALLDASRPSSFGNERVTMTPTPASFDVPAAASDDAAADERSPAPKLDSSAEAGSAEAHLQAMTHFRMAESALQRGDVAQTEKLAHKATKGEPAHGDYLALYTWIRAMGTHTDTGILEAIVTLNKIIDNDPSERALLYRGKLWKRMKKVRDALRELQRVLELNPRHREAASEVRLIKQSRAK